MSSTAERVCSLTSVISARPAPVRASTRLRAASALSRTPVSAGPSPSCRSRRMRLRSSSSAAMVRCREACSSSVRTTECTAGPACRTRSCSSAAPRPARPRRDARRPGRRPPRRGGSAGTPPSSRSGLPCSTVRSGRRRAGRPARATYGQRQRVGDGGGDGGQHLVGCHGRLQPAAQLGEHPVGVGARAEHQPVDQPLQPRAQRGRRRPRRRRSPARPAPRCCRSRRLRP